MNKIELVDNQIIHNQVDNSLFVQIEKDEKIQDINCIKITILQNCELNIQIKNCTQSWKFVFLTHPNVSFQLNEIQINNQGKIQYQYKIEENSKVTIEKVHSQNTTKESNIIYLKGKYARIDQHLKTICSKPQNYDLMIYHQAPFTISHIHNHGVNIEEGNLIINVSSFVPNKQIKSEVDQVNRIINLTQNTCKIQPNLFIDENDVIANHSAHIGTFSQEEFFYLQSRGIPYTQAMQLLIQGFLLQGIVNTENKKYIQNIINKV